MYSDELLCAIVFTVQVFKLYNIILICTCMKIINVFFFLVLQNHGLEKKAEGSCILSPQLQPTLESLKTVQIKSRCPSSDTKDQEIFKLFSDWGTCPVKFERIR
jgi:hypothetical protein